MSPSGASAAGRARANGHSRRRALALGVFAAALAFTTSSPAWASLQLGQRHKPPHGAPDNTTTTVPSMPLPAPPPALSQDTCVKGAWQPTVEGRPTAYAAQGYGVYLWHDPDGGWALRVTNSGVKQKVVFSGFLTSVGGELTDVSTVSQGGNDIVYQTAGKRVVYFRFVNFGQADGLNFGTDCTRAFMVNVHIGPRLVPTGDIYLGAAGANPPSNPFRVQRAHLDNSSVIPKPGPGRTSTTTT